MRRRECLDGLPRAEDKFRRVKRHRAVPALRKALESLIRADPLESGVTLRKNARTNRAFRAFALRTEMTS
jgi:hypothetical protein